MTIDFDNAFEIDNGIILSRDGAYFTGGVADPTGSDAPLGTWYIKTDDITIWRKFGAGVNDWRQLSAQDIPFDITNVLANSPDVSGITQLQELGETLADRHFGKDSVFNQADGPFSTTSGTFVDVFTVNLNVSANPSGTYRLGWNAQDITSKSNTVGEVEIVVDSGLPSEIIVDTDIITFVESRFSGFDSGVIDNGARTIDLRIRRTAGNGTVSLSNVSIEAWRVL